MADRIKDAEDRMLEAMFAAEPIADDGFSEKIVRQIRRRLWLRRLALPIAVLLGAAIAVEPALEFIQAIAGLSVLIPDQSITIPTGWIPQLQTIVLAGMLVVTGVFGLRMIEE
jgi:hypothetical protein